MVCMVWTDMSKSLCISGNISLNFQKAVDMIKIAIKITQKYRKDVELVSSQIKRLIIKKNHVY